MKIYYTILALVFIASSLLEHYLTYKEHKNYFSMKDFKSSVALMVAGLVVDFPANAVAVYFLIQLSSISLFSFGYDWWVWALCYLTWDFIFYWKHYLEHNVRFMWAIHVNHHSSPYMNMSTALRSGFLKCSYRYFFWAIIVLLGFPLPMFLILYGVGKVWALFGHSQHMGNWGVFEKFLITPNHHLLHHSYNEDNLNKNFAETFLFWDKLFGTFKTTTEPLKYGIGEDINHHDFKEVVFHEFKKMRHELKHAHSLKSKLKIIFGRPGSHLY